MEKTALLFPGQGSQTMGMGKELYDTYASAREVFTLGSKVLNRSLEELCFETPDQTLSETVHSQPAIFTVSMAMLAVLKEKNFAFDGVSGFSLGEVASLVAADVLSLTDGFIAIDKRSLAMQQAAEQSKSGMAAIIGLDAATVENVCASVDGYVIAVNYNCPGQTVIAGENAALDAAIEKCIALKALKAVRLSVGAAFHSKLMDDAATTLSCQLKNMQQNAPSCDMFSNVTADTLESDTKVCDYLKVQMTSPVRFEKSIRNMIDRGYVNFLEVGAGRVLSGLVKRISREVRILNFGDVIA